VQQGRDGKPSSKACFEDFRHTHTYFTHEHIYIAIIDTEEVSDSLDYGVSLFSTHPEGDSLCGYPL